MKKNEIRKAVAKYFQENKDTSKDMESLLQEIFDVIMAVQYEQKFSQWFPILNPDNGTLDYFIFFPNDSFWMDNEKDREKKVAEMRHSKDIVCLVFHTHDEFFDFLKFNYKREEILLSSDDADTLFDKHTSNLESMITCLMTARQSIHEAKKTKEKLVQRAEKRVQEVQADKEPENVALGFRQDSFIKASSKEYLNECKVCFFIAYL